MHRRLADTRINSSTNSSTWYEKMVKIGPVVFEIIWLTECLYSTSVKPQMRLHNYIMMKYITIKWKLVREYNCVKLTILTIKWCRKWKLCYDSPEISRFAFWNVLEYHNFHFSRLIWINFCTSCDNLVRFGLVISEFWVKVVVWPESIIVTTVTYIRYVVGC